MKRIGFTLAEVLITLAIIGVVAAITIPSLIDKYKCIELKTGLKEAYSILQQALMMMNTDYGYTVTPQNFTTRTFKAQYMEYFDNPIDCEYGGFHASGSEIFCPSGTYDTNTGINYQYSNTYKIYNKSSDTKLKDNYLDDGQFALKNGMLVMIENSSPTSSGYLFISVDVNGIGRGPNAWGHDLFTFQLMSDGRLTPMGADDTMFPVENYPNYCSASSTNAYNGLSCTYNALTNKNYFKNLP